MNSFMGALFYPKRFSLCLMGLPYKQLIPKILWCQCFGLDRKLNLIIQRRIGFFALLFQPVRK